MGRGGASTVLTCLLSELVSMAVPCGFLPRSEPPSSRALFAAPETRFLPPCRCTIATRLISALHLREFFCSTQKLNRLAIFAATFVAGADAAIDLRAGFFSGGLEENSQFVRHALAGVDQSGLDGCRLGMAVGDKMLNDQKQNGPQQNHLQIWPGKHRALHKPDIMRFPGPIGLNVDQLVPSVQRGHRLGSRNT